MPGGNWSLLVTVTTGQLITASERNNEFLNVIANANQDGIAGASEDLAHMQATTNPAPGGSPSLATAGRGEIQALRYMIAAITGKTQWYTAPDTTLAALVVGTIPIGGVIEFPSATPPNSNFKLADGTAIGRVTYATLFSLISTTFGVGDGSTTFNLPNYTDKFSIGAGNLYALGTTGGAATHTLTTTELPHLGYTVTDPGHLHSISDPGHGHSINDPTHTHVEKAQTGVGGGAVNHLNASSSGSGTNTNMPESSAAASTGVTVGSNTTGISGTASASTGISVADSNGGSSHSILNPYLAMYKMIRVQ